MKLMTKELQKKFPEWRSTDGNKLKDTPIIAKYFLPPSGWTWYATEFDGDDTFFGYVDGIEGEWGYFSLSELESIELMGCKVERDLYFEHKTMADIVD